MKFGVVTFPGTCDDTDARLAASLAGEAVQLWHGDHLRVGAVARFSPVMREVATFAAAGGPVLGICNGFQVLCEAGLLPGALLPNTSLRFAMRQCELRVENAESSWTRGCEPGELLSIPAKHTSGRYYASEPVREEMDERGQIVLRYVSDPIPNGSVDGIAGVCNAAGNVMGLMPHPEHAVDELTGSADGLKLFRSPALVPA